MQLPVDLLEIIGKAFKVTKHNPDGNLNLGYRQAIRAKFGPRLNPDIPESKIAHQKRAFLDIVTIKPEAVSSQAQRYQPGLSFELNKGKAYNNLLLELFTNWSID